MYFILYLLVIQNVNCDPVYIREELYEVTDYNPDRFNINISSEIQGSIVLKWSNSPSFNIYVQISTEDVNGKTQNPVHIEKNFTWENLHLRVLKRISETVVSSPSSLNANRGLTTVGSFLLTFWVIILTHGWKVAVLYMVLLLSMILLVDASLMQNSRCDIILECPRNLSLHGLKLFVEDGNITVDKELLQITNTTPECVTSSYHVHSRNGCGSCCYGNGVCGPGNTCKCFKGFSQEDCRKPDSPKYNLYVNPGDSRITQIKLLTKETVTVHGRKRHDGTIRSLDTFRSHDQNGSDVTVRLNKSRKIQNVLSHTGARLSFDWKDKCIAHVTATTSKGQGQVNIEVNTCASLYELFPFDAQRESNISRLLPVAMALCSQRDRQVRSVEENQGSKFPRKDDLDLKSKIKSNSENKYSKFFVPVKITRCGSPVTSVDVYARVKGNKNTDKTKSGQISEFIAKPTKWPGLFHVQIPSRPVKQDEINIRKSCDSFNSTVYRTCRKVITKFSCDKFKFCLSVREAFRFVKSVLPTQIDDVIQTCEKAFDTVLAFCLSISQSLQSHNLDSCIQSDNLIDSYSAESILFSPFAVFDNGYVLESESIEINPTPDKKYSQGVTLRDRRPNPSITGFSITPEDPKPLQRYEVKVNYSCASNATVIDMQIVGSDKYTNFATCYGITSCNCCVLHVAGAAASVKDIVTVTVTDSLINLNFTREFVVIF